jgi:hypothetical protein
MALSAQTCICGLKMERLIEYFHWWEENRALPRRDSGCEISRNEWHQHLGDAQMFDALSNCFRRWVLDRGSTEVIGAVFSRISGGVAAAAFHGLIRLAYGIEADHAGEIGAGLPFPLRAVPRDSRRRVSLIQRVLSCFPAEGE